MTITVQPITPNFGADIGDVVLGKPLAAADLAEIRAAFTKYAVLVFPDQQFDDDSQLDFARNFGPLETTVFKARKEHKLRLHENMADVGNRRGAPSCEKRGGAEKGEQGGHDRNQNGKWAANGLHARLFASWPWKSKRVVGSGPSIRGFDKLSRYSG